MRSMKHVKRGHRVRTNRNAAACKRNAYRRKMQAKRNWQSNTIFTGYRQPVLHAPEVAHCTVKEPKQRSPEELAERQRAREQKRLEKELAKQKASTSALPKPKKIKKEKKLAEPVVQKVVHTQATAKPKSNKVAAEGQKQKGAAKETKADSCAKQGKKDKKVVEEKKEKTPTVEGKSKKKKESTKPDMGQAEPKVEAPVTNNVVEEPFQQEHHAVNHAVPEKTHEEPVHHDEPAGKGKKHRKQKGRQSESEKPLEVEQPQENEKEPEEVATEVHMDASKKHKKRRNRKSESEHHLPSPDSINYVQGDPVEMDEADQVEGGEFTAVVSRHQKKKNRRSESEAVHEDSPVVEAPKESDVKPEDKHENGGMAEVPVAAPPVDLASCAQNGSPQETNVHKETEVYTVGSVPEKNQVVVDKEVLTLDSNASPEQFAANMAQLAKEHPELLENSNLAALGEGVTGKMTVTTYTTKTSAVPEAPKATVTKRDPLVLAIEREKRAELIKQRRERVYKLLPRDVDFCTRMLEAHKDDFQAMADDPTNVYQETAKAIQRKIRIFRESPQFETYVKSKNTSPAVSPVPQ